MMYQIKQVWRECVCVALMKICVLMRYSGEISIHNSLIGSVCLYTHNTCVVLLLYFYKLHTNIHTLCVSVYQHGGWAHLPAPPGLQHQWGSSIGWNTVTLIQRHEKCTTTKLCHHMSHESSFKNSLKQYLTYCALYLMMSNVPITVKPL